MKSFQICVVTIAAFTILVILAPNLSLPQIVSADKNCSVGKALNELFPSPKRGNQVGKDAVLGKELGPGPGVSHYSLETNEKCRSQR